MDTNIEPAAPPARPAPPAGPPGPGKPSTQEGLLRLLALLSLLGASAGLYILAGAVAMSTVATAGTALFATWQHRGDPE